MTEGDEGLVADILEEARRLASIVKGWRQNFESCVDPSASN